MSEKPKKKAHLSLETTEPMSFGSGFISGILSSILGIFGLGIVLGGSTIDPITASMR